MSAGVLAIVAFPLGLLLAWAYVKYARLFGERELMVLASGLVIAALIYLVAALVQGANGYVLLFEFGGVVLFGTFAVMGLRLASVWLAVGWALHVGFDVAEQLADDPVLPLWYASACLSFDLVVAGAILSANRSSGRSREP